ncbi:MAG: leucine-rich repeat protein [Muribaculum sp.]|nr:leucine-rich repeat protein [Muribaculum sp.]
MIGNRKFVRRPAGRLFAFALAVVLAATALPCDGVWTQAAPYAEDTGERVLRRTPGQNAEEIPEPSISDSLSAHETGTMDGGRSYSLSGTCGDHITYTLEQGVLTLSGYGDMKSFYAENQDPENPFVYYPDTNAPWSAYAEEIRQLVLDDRITSIGESAFMGLTGLVGEVKLPSGLKTIGQYAFQDCTAAGRKLTLPETLTSIGEFAFDGFALGCSEEYGQEVSLVLPQSLKEIGECAFQGYSVQKVYVSNAATKFGQDCIGSWGCAFYGAEGSTAERYAKENGYTFFVWTPGQNTYVVTFDSNGGSAVEAQEVEIGGTAAMPAQPVREGWYFMGWYLDGRQFDFDTVLTGNITLTAHWSDVDPATLPPVLSLKNIGSSTEELTLTWERSFDERLKGYEIYRAVGADGEYGRIGSAEASTTSYIDDAGFSYERSQYHYKIQGVYEGDVRTPFSNVVSTQGMIYSGLEDWDEDCVRAQITDAQGNPIDALTLHVGESSPELRVRLIYQDGSGEDWKSVVVPLAQSGLGYYWNEWRVSEGGFSPAGNDGLYARFLPTFDYLGMDSDASGASAQLVGIAPTPADASYYVSVTLQGCTGGIAIPLTVLEAEPGVDYDNAQGLTVYDNTDGFWEAVRASFRDRQESFCVLLDREVFEKVYGGDADFFDLIDEEAFDFYEDRPGMKSGEGDYLGEGLSRYESSTQTVSYYGDSYAAMVLSNVGYLTTKEQEDWMDEQIDKMVNRPGGRFYSDRNKSDYDKIKAVYEYVADQITWVDGTNEGLYHTAYSGLHDGKGTCQSYALLFYRLIREMGISAKVLMGTDAGAHTYNIVELGGKYYYIDCSDKRFLKGSKNFKTSPLQELWQDPRFIQNFMDKISVEDYRPGEGSVLSAVTALDDGQIKALDGNLLQTADKMAAVYTVKGSEIIAKNASKSVLMPVYGCTGYLGADPQTAAGEIGYYLGLRIQADPSKFTEDGRIVVSCEQAGEWISQEYSFKDSTLRDGYVDVILNLSKSDAVTVAVDYDTDSNASVYQETRYSLNTAALKKGAFEKFSTPEEETVQGMEASSFLTRAEDAGQKVTVSYQCVAYSPEVLLPGKTEKTAGNYAALRVDAPESMKGTASFTGQVRVETPEDDAFYSRVAEDGSYVTLVFKIAEPMAKDLVIAWTEQEKQTVRVETAQHCVIEIIDEKARLPKSIKFNGLSSTIYVGQERTADVSIVKYYEGDVIQKVFTSDNPSVISINRVTGELQALKPGTATITVTARDGDGNTPKDDKGRIAKGLTASVKMTVKVPTAPGGVKITQIKDTAVTANWKANTTGQQMEIYALPINKDTMGKAKNNWKSSIEAALTEQGMDDRFLSDLSDTQRQRLQDGLEAKFGVSECALASASAGAKTQDIAGLRADTPYVFYFRCVSQSRTGALYFAGAVSGQTKTKKKILTQVSLAAQDEAGRTLSGDLFVLGNGSQAVPVQLFYSVQDADAAYTKVSYKSTNTKVASADKNGRFKLGTQAGTAQLYVTGKDASGTVRESNRITVRVIKEPQKLTAKKTTLALGQSVRLRDVVGYDVKGSASEINLEKVDFEAALAQIRRTNCFDITPAADAADTVITAAAFLTDAAGNAKSGNSLQVPVELYAAADHATSANPVSAVSATLRITDMAQPVIRKITARDTSAIVKFKPAATVREPSGYTAEIIDKATGESAADARYAMAESDESTEKNPLYVCTITGLSAEHDYSVRITAHYGSAECACAAKKFKTLKPLLATGGSIDINYIDLQELRKNPASMGRKVDDSKESILLQSNETYVFMAQVKKLNRVLGADKLKWTISSDTKKIATVKVSKDTYQAQINPLKAGTFTVTVTSTLSKETLSVFHVTVVPYAVAWSEASEESAGYGRALLSTDSDGPVIRSVVPRDTTAAVKFVPDAAVLSLAGADGFYSITLKEKTTGREADAEYRFLIGEDSTQTAPLYTCEISGLDRNKAYTVAVTAHQGADGSRTKTSPEISFTTRKAMLTDDDVLDVRVVSMEELRKEPDAEGILIGSEGIAIPWQKSYALTADVNNLSRALETEKVSWVVSDKQAVTLKVSASTFEAQLEVKEIGIYTITATSTLTKKKLAEFTVNTMQSAAEQEKEIYDAIIAMKDKYPEGTPWTNDNYYAWKGGIYSGGYGCAGFAFMLSDAAFGSAPARQHTDPNAVRVGDIARINGNTHSVIILEVRSDSVIVAEGNYNSSVHWGREISRSTLEDATYFITRY